MGSILGYMMQASGLSLDSSRDTPRMAGTFAGLTSRVALFTTLSMPGRKMERFSFMPAALKLQKLVHFANNHHNRNHNSKRFVIIHIFFDFFLLSSSS
jgi:hypothetical protein